MGGTGHGQRRDGIPQESNSVGTGADAEAISIPPVPAFGKDGFNADDYEGSEMGTRAEIDVGMDAGREYYSDSGGYGGDEYSRYGGDYVNRTE